MLIAVQIVFSYRPQQFWAHCPVAHLGNAEHIGSCLAHRFTSTHIPKKKECCLSTTTELNCYLSLLRSTFKFKINFYNKETHFVS